MKFIHAVIFDKDEYESAIKYGADFTDWGQVCDGDYVVHCLYDIDNRDVVILEDNTHQPVEAMIENFLHGLAYASVINIGGYMHYADEPEAQKAYVVMNEGESSYSEAEVLVHLLKGEYVEVND